MTRLIWWTSGDESREIGLVIRDFPQWLKIEWTSRCGRNGRGRIWAAPHLRKTSVFGGASAWNTALGRYLERCCAGIVITDEDLPLLAELPGIVTDLELRRQA